MTHRSALRTSRSGRLRRLGLRGSSRRRRLVRAGSSGRRLLGLSSSGGQRRLGRSSSVGLLLRRRWLLPLVGRRLRLRLRLLRRSGCSWRRSCVWCGW